MRPPFAYYGDKVGMSQLIVGLMPPHRVYIEPFFGSGAVMFAKPPATHEIANDLDGNVVNFFKVLRDRPDDLARVCALTPYSREEYQVSRPMEVDDELERARRFWVRVNQSFSKTAGRRTGWSVTTARTQSPARSVMGRIDRFATVAARLQPVCFEQCDAADLVDRLANDETLVYCDPPYLAGTRSSTAIGREVRDYSVDMGQPEAHVRLAQALHDADAKVLLSGYPSELYEQLYADWHRIEVPVRVHSSNAVAVDRAQRTEVLWANYAPPRVEQLGLIGVDTADQRVITEREVAS